MDEANRATLQALPDSARYRFHSLLSFDEAQASEIDIEELLEKAQRELREFDGSVDAIVGYWDFPVSSMVPILCERFGLRSASLEAVLKCEHKYWSRLEQQKVIDEYPRFGLVSLDDRVPPAGLRYPLWLKPVKAFSSELAFKVDDDGQFRAALATVREGIHRFAKPFEVILSKVDAPEEVTSPGGSACVVEETATGSQVTVEGYCRDGQVHVYGVVDSVNYSGTSSFLRFEYPSAMPAEVTGRMTDIAERVITHIGLEWVFNIEFFWDRERNTIRLLEINPRHSQSHARLFELVDGVPNHQCMIRLACGRDPELPYRQGQYPVAAKWFFRRFADGVVRRAPNEQEIAAVERDVPGTSVELVAHVGDRLSELPEQDSYSYHIATIHVGAEDETDLESKYQRCVDALCFEFDE